MMRARTILLILLSSMLIFGCATVEKYSGKALLAVGGAVAKAMEGTSATVSDVTPFIKLNNVNRPRAFTSLEKEYMAKAGMEAPDEPSSVTILFSKGMKLLQIEGDVQVNGQSMDYFGSGMYILPTAMENGAEFNFSVKGSAEDAVEFTEVYQGEKITLTSPAPGAELDLSKGFEIEWTPGTDTSKQVKLSMMVTQIGLENVLPVAIFNDVGKATITPEMLAETLQPAQKFKDGANILMLERQKDAVRYVFNGDAVVSYVDTDAIDVTVMGEPAKRSGPAIPAITATEGDVSVTISESLYKYNPTVGAVADVDRIKKVGLSSFVFRGVTGGSWEKTESYGNYIKTTTKRWGYDFGVPVLTQMAEYMANGVMASISVGMGAEEVPKEAFINTEAYKRMATLDSKSDSKTFVVKARDLADFSSWKNIKVRVGGTDSWYFDMMQSSDADAFVECYINANRREPEEGKWTDFIFDMNIVVSFRAYQGNLISPMVMPPAIANYTTDTITITEETTYEDMLKAFKIEEFMLAYATALNQWLDANKMLES